MKYIAPILLLTSILMSCQNEETKRLYKMSDDSLWNHLAFQTGGCLTGGQHVYNGEFGGEGCVMSNKKDWKIFFARDKKQLTDFLITKLTGDTTKTRIHTCPFFEATEGELAVYSLQNIYRMNWYDLEEFKEYQDKESENSIENHQSWLQRILQDEIRREILINCWKKKAHG